MTTRQRVASALNILSSVGLKAGGALLALGFQWLVAREFGPSGTGQFAVLATTSTLFGIVCLFGQDYIGLRNVASDLAVGDVEEAAAKARLSIRLVLLGCPLAAVLILATAAYYRWDQGDAQLATNLLLVLPVCWGVSLGRVYSFIARAKGSVVASQLADGPINSGSALVMFAALMLVADQPSRVWIGAIYGASYLVALGYAWWLYRRISADWPSQGDAGLGYRELLASGLPLVVLSTMSYVTDWITVTFVTAYHSAATAGLVRIVTMVLTVMYMMTIAFDSALSQKMTAAIRLGNARHARRLYLQHAAGAVGFNAPIVLVAVLFPGFVLGFFGPEFVPAAQALQIGVIIQALSLALGPGGLFLVLSANERLSLWVNAAGLVVCLLFAFALIPDYGVLGGVLAYSVTLLAKRVCEVIFLAVYVPHLSIFRRNRAAETA